MHFKPDIIDQKVTEMLGDKLIFNYFNLKFILRSPHNKGTSQGSNYTNGEKCSLRAIQRKTDSDSP